MDNNMKTYSDYTCEYGSAQPTGKDEWRRFIHSKLAEYSDDNGHRISIHELSRSIGVPYEMFRQAFYMTKPTKKRDFIIALGICMNWTTGEINEALVLYNYMPSLAEDNPRDELIIAAVNQKGTVKINDVNSLLSNRGFPPLNIHDTRTGQKKKVVNKPPIFRAITKIRVRFPSIEHSERSLNMEYSPITRETDVFIGLKNLTDSKIVELHASPDGKMFLLPILEESYDYSGVKNFKSLGETGVYQAYFVELLSVAQKEKDRVLELLNDTRNFKNQQRVSANWTNDSFRLFCEEYNSDLPELNEYYVMTYINEEYHFFIYRRSAFMWYYLKEEVYTDTYGCKAPEILKEYSSEDDIKKDIAIDKLTKIRQNSWLSMKSKINDLLSKLKERKVFIQDREIYCSDGEVFAYYGLETDYHCEKDKYGGICRWDESKEYTYDNATVTISANDVFRSYELGIHSIDDICRIKSKYGCIDGVIS